MAKRTKTTKKAPKKGQPAGKRRLPKPTKNALAALSFQQARFVEEYLLDLNATQAAIRAGYSQKSAFIIGWENLRKPNIAAAVTESREKLSDKLDVTLEDLAVEMRKLAYSNALDYVRVLPNGEPAVDFSQLTRSQAAAITEITVEDYTDGRGEDAREVKRVRYKVESKRQAIMDLAKLLGHVTDKVEHSGGVTVTPVLAEAQVEAKRASPEQVAAVVAAYDELHAKIAAIQESTTAKRLRHGGVLTRPPGELVSQT